MRGIELMLMGIFATFNGTDYYKGKPPEIDGTSAISFGLDFAWNFF